MVERYEGCMVGLAVGDALGAPTEFLSLPEIRRRYGPQGVEDFKPRRGLPPGSYTDDTQMSIAVALGLLESADALTNPEAVIESICRRFVWWLEEVVPQKRRGPGNTCLRGCNALSAGVPWRESGDRWSKGCGAAMRSAPIGLVYRSRHDLLREVAYGASVCTHAHPAGVASGIATAFLVSRALDGVTYRLVAELLDFVGDISEEFNQRVRMVEEALALPPEEALPRLGEGWVGDEAVACALYCFLRSPHDYKATVLTAANTNGDSDSIACIAGAISGAFNGVGAIPEKWAREVEDSEQLFALGRNLADVAAKLEQGHDSGADDD